MDPRARLIFPTMLLAVLAGLSADSTNAKSPSPADRQFFENHIRPALVKHCYACHSKEADELGGKLRLDDPGLMQKGGESGALLVAGKPDESLLIHALKYDGVEMPPEQPLPEPVIQKFVEWVRRGAPDPRADGKLSKSGPLSPSKAGNAKVPETTSGDRIRSDLWSLQPINSPAVPDVENPAWPYDAIDAFVLNRIEAAGTQPTRDADARTLVRRLYFDLIGLPPTIDEVEHFTAEHEQQGVKATARLVDRLLSSHHFGEHWGRHWLDVARYAESNGNDGLGRNPSFPHAWRYRDYVIDAFNNDLPYDRFVTEQIAGDLLPHASDEQRDRQLVATGFLAMTAKPAKAMNNNFDMDVVADQIDVVGRGIIGLSVGCARCHDHKFDPIPTRDYYALAGIFTSSKTMWGNGGYEKLSSPVTPLHVLKATPHVKPPADFIETVINRDSATGVPKAIPKSQWPIGTPLAMGLREGKKPADCKINLNGESQKLGESVPRGFLRACYPLSPHGENSGGDGPDPQDRFAIGPDESGRLQLAHWLTDPRHPLTARVMVNRIWLHLFGDGIVRTPDDFGVYGAPPTHPQLLDHLATRFVEGGWSMKEMIRAIVLSRTYQLSSDASLQSGDDESRLLTRHNRRRLAAESLRDSMLVASGRLVHQPRQGSLIRHRDILINLGGNLHEPSDHRSVYLCYLRSSPPPSLSAFDLPDFSMVNGRRVVSTVPGHALHLYNNPFVLEQAKRFAQRILDRGDADADRVRAAFRCALQREPSAEELLQSLRLVRDTTADLQSVEQAWQSLCQALLMTNEFRYID